MLTAKKQFRKAKHARKYIKPLANSSNLQLEECIPVTVVTSSNLRLIRIKLLTED